MISKRLKTIADMIHDNASIADIGADHGNLENYLVSKDNFKKILAIENKIGPFNILKKNLVLSSKVSISLSDGMEQVDDSFDTLIIAGMGGNLIKSILLKHPEKLENIKQIVVDSHNDIDLVRSSIINLGFHIEKEQIVKENSKYYFIISFIKGKRNHSSLEIAYGFNIKNDPLFDEYLNYKLGIINDILKQNISDKKREELEQIKKELTSL